MNKIENILVILANTPQDSSHRDGLLYDLFKTYIAEIKKSTLSVSIIDMSKESPGFLCGGEDRKDKIEEYQIKIKNADLITIFHPVFWSMPSSDIKGFVDKVFIPGFAYNTQRGIVYGQLENKNLEVFAVTDSAKWHEMFVSNNALSYFWNRIVSDKCGFERSKLNLIANYRSLSDKDVAKWHEKTKKSVINLNTSTSILDLF